MRISNIVKEDVESISKGISELASRLSGKTVLISGGAGFLGKYFVLTLDYLNKNVLTKPCKIIIMDNFISSLKENFLFDENVQLIQQDITKPINISEPIHFILHAASIASPVFYNKFRLETIDVGILGTKNLLELAKEKKVESFLFFSSSEVYGNPDPRFIPTPETYLGNVSCVGPRACYDEPKRIGETLCVTYADIYNLPVKIVRPFNVYGPGMRLDDGRAVPNFVATALKGEKIPVYGTGNNTRTFCYITDAITGFFKVLLSDHNREVFNVGSDDQEISMKHLADMVQGLVANTKSSIHTLESSNEMYQTKSDPNRRCPDLTKIRTMLNYSPKVSLITGIRRFIAWAEEEISLNPATKQAEGVKCRICDNRELKTVVSLGKSPLANNLSTENDLGSTEMYPLEMMYCPKCHLCQLSFVAPPEKMFKHYVYMTSTTKTFREHFAEMAETLSKGLSLGRDSLVVDIGSNDGLLLEKFKGYGIKVLGVEPADNIAKIAQTRGIDTVCDFFSKPVVENIIQTRGRADVVTANNVFAHIDDIKEVVSNVKTLLKQDGVFCIEVQYLLDTIQKMSFDNIYHEHVSYYSVLALNEFFRRQDMEIFRVEHVNSHGGSIRVFVQRKAGKFSIDSSVPKMISAEFAAGLDRLQTYEEFGRKVYAIRDKFRDFMDSLKSANKTVIGYGAPAKATTFLNFSGVNKDHIRYIIEDNPLKHGLFVPGVNIPIVSKEQAAKESFDYIAILAWNFADEIINNNRALIKNGAKFIIPSPEPKILQSDLLLMN